jgi:hypothetical protein
MEEPASLQDRNDKPCEALEVSGKIDRKNIEAVCSVAPADSG